MCSNPCESEDQTAFFLAPIITDFIQNTKRELYDEKLEDALEMLDLEWSKEMTPRRSATGCTPVHFTEEMRPTRMVQHG